MTEWPHDHCPGHPTRQCPDPYECNARGLCAMTGACGGEEKKFDPQLVRRVTDGGVVIEEWI